MPTKGQYTDADLAPVPGVAAPTVPADQGSPSTLRTIGTGLANLGIGAGKGALHTISSLDDWSRQHLPAFMTNQNFGFGPPANLEHVKQMATPEGTMQKIGYGGEQVGEFLLPSGLEKGAAAGLIKAAPALEKVAPLVRTGIGALSSGAVNKLQGGSFTGGAATGLAGGAAGEGLRMLAPKIAESALNITKADRAFGKTPGRAILEETRGIRPSKIAATGEERLQQLTPELERQAAASPQVASLTPARQVISDAEQKAITQNAQSLHGQLTPMSEFLSRRFDTSQAIPANVTPSELLNLKRGFSKEFLGRWNPETYKETIGTGRQAYRALDTELDRTVPEAAGLNQRISSLIPVVHRAESTARNAPLAQKIVGRFVAPTGALASTIVGGMEGAQRGGLGGALLGGGAGLVTPLLVGTPEGQMIAARMFNSPMTGRAIRAVITPAARYLVPPIGVEQQGQ